MHEALTQVYSTEAGEIVAVVNDPRVPRVGDNFDVQTGDDCLHFVIESVRWQAFWPWERTGPKSMDVFVQVRPHDGSGGWNPIESGLPAEEHGQWMVRCKFVNDPETYTEVAWRDGSDTWWVGGSGSERAVEVTHWKPMPEPPAGECGTCGGDEDYVEPQGQ